jgi:hypothetical protein
VRRQNASERHAAATQRGAAHAIQDGSDIRRLEKWIIK